MIKYFIKDNVLFAASGGFDETYIEITEAEYTQRLNEAISKRASNVTVEDVLVEEFEEVLADEIEEVIEDVLY